MEEVLAQPRDPKGLKDVPLEELARWHDAKELLKRVLPAQVRVPVAAFNASL